MLAADTLTLPVPLSWRYRSRASGSGCLLTVRTARGDTARNSEFGGSTRNLLTRAAEVPSTALARATRDGVVDSKFVSCAEAAPGAASRVPLFGALLGGVVTRERPTPSGSVPCWLRQVSTEVRSDTSFRGDHHRPFTGISPIDRVHNINGKNS